MTAGAETLPTITECARGNTAFPVALLAIAFDPQSVTIPKRFTEITTRKGPVDGAFLQALKNA